MDGKQKMNASGARSCNQASSLTCIRGQVYNREYA